MSRNSKNSKRVVKARQFSKIRKEGGRSPSVTKKLNDKVNTWWKKKQLGITPTAKKPKDDDGTVEVTA